MSEDGISAKGLVEFVECGSSFWSPGQGLGFQMEHGSEWSSKDAEILDESATEVCEAGEMLELLYYLRLKPTLDGLDLPLVLLNTIGAQDVTEELDVT